MQINKPIVGLTGGIASGKSTVASFFRLMGDCDVVSSDEVSREVMQPGHPCYLAVVAEFGTGILGKADPNNPKALRPIDRKLLRNLVFGNTPKKNAAREKLEKITHPFIRQREQELFAQSTKDYILWDVPLLIEKGLWRDCNEVIVVQADRQTQILRALERDPSANLKVIVDILNTQASNEQRAKYADFIILNNENVTKTELISKVAKINGYIMDGTVKRFRKNQQDLVMKGRALEAQRRADEEFENLYSEITTKKS
ncbi:dephospho-CoA kinase [Psittacicella hinzii]|uniref:Dephospho-CoA kinase n=1 Tax=Psittacicella hinzii TaxID=2028575 RepID=A0A3A1YDH2_9GAMM|nr:dephospho-CoA kinase [Psittacicella hinzii]RIY35591.1 dephospho-CoA kinase [Psittacicella hinzii]